MRQERRLNGASPLLAFVVLAATLIAACSKGGNSAATPTATAAAFPEATATIAATPTAETIAGVSVTPLHAGKPADIPAGAVLYVEGGCTQCDGPATSLDRVYRDAAGGLHSDRLFERKLRVENGTTYEENYIRTMRVSSTGNDIVIGVCDRGYCGGVGNATPDARTTFYGTNDGGITWKEMGQLTGDTWIIAVSGSGAMVRHAYQPSEGAPYRWEIVQLPSGEPAVVDPAIDIKTTNIITVGDWTPLAVGADGMSLLWLPGPVNGTPWLGPQLPAGSQVLDARFSPSGGEGGVALVRWSSASPPNSYLGLMQERQGKPTAIFADTPDTSISFLGQWLAPSTLVGNATLPATALDSPLAASGFAWGIPSLTDLKTGEVRAIQPLIERVLKGDRARILGAAPGPFVKVAGAGDCLNVRERTSTASLSLGCYKDGVLLKDRGEMRVAEGITWIGVVAPRQGTLYSGWASAEFLEAPGRDMGVKPIAHPRGARTGNPAIDAVITALEAGNKEAIARLAQFRAAPCTNEEGLGGPPKCSPGVAPGTPIEAMPSGGCEGGWWLKDEFLSAEGLGRFIAAYRDPQLYAVYRPPASAQRQWPGGDVIIVYVHATGSGRFAQTIGVTDRHIVSTWGGCGTKPEDILKDAPGVSVILAPPK